MTNKYAPFCNFYCWRDFCRVTVAYDVDKADRYCPCCGERNTHR